MMLSEWRRKPRLRASAAEVDTVAFAMVSKFFLIASKISTPSPRASGRIDDPASMLRRSISLQPPPAWNKADSSLNKPHIKLRVRLARRSMQRDLDTAAETHPIRRNDHRARAELDRLRHV